jgi:hypothetical protein
MATLIKRLLPFLMGLGLVSGCQAGWLNPSQQGFVIQTFTSYQPISGNNSGTIVTNGNSYQVAGDNTGAIYIGGPGSQFRGKNDGNLSIDGDGAFVLGSFGSLASVTNRGKGSLVLGNLSVGQKAMITDVGNAAILIGAGTVSNSQSIVVGDGNASHGNKSVTAGSFWGMGSGFFGNGAGLTNLPTDLSRFAVADATVLSGRVTDVETNLAAVNGNAGNYLSSERTIWVATNGSDSADGRTPEKAKLTLAAGISAVGGTNWTVIVRDGVYVLSNTVWVTNRITVKSENGPARCVVDGNGTNRCFYIQRSTLDGFSITRGWVFNEDGAGIYIFGGTVRNCRVYGNTAAGTGTGGNGAGVFGYMMSFLIENSQIYSNTAFNNGGGIHLAAGTIRNCLIYGNAANWGGGIYAQSYGISLNTSLIEGTTISRNTATGTGGGGIFLSNECGNTTPMTTTIRSTISYGNTGATDPNYKTLGIIHTPVTFSCISPLVAGDGNMASDPSFLSSNDFHLAPTSPCVNGGTNLTLAAGAIDLDGNPRVNGGRTDIGAFESPAFHAVLAGSSPSFNCVTGNAFFGNGAGLTNLTGYLPVASGGYALSDPSSAEMWSLTGMTYTNGALARDLQTGTAYATGMAAVVVGRTYVVRFRLFQTLTTVSSVFFGGYQWDFSGGHVGDSMEFTVTAVDINVFGCSYGTTVSGQFGLDTMSVYLVPRATTTGEIEADSGIIFGGGTLKVIGNQLVFVVGAVTNVLDADIMQP